MPDTTLIVSDGCLSSDTLKNAGKAADGVYGVLARPVGVPG